MTCWFYRNWCAACVEGRGVGGQHRIELLEEEKRERTTPIVAYEYRFMTQEHAHTLPVLIGQTGATCCERKGPTAYSISFLVAFIKDPGFRRVSHSEMCYMNRARNHFKDAVIQACAGEDVFFHRDHMKVDHTANGRVHAAVREVDKHCRTLQIFLSEQNTSVRIANDSPLLSWLPCLQRKS